MDQPSMAPDTSEDFLTVDSDTVMESLPHQPSTEELLMVMDSLMEATMDSDTPDMVLDTPDMDSTIKLFFYNLP